MKKVKFWVKNEAKRFYQTKDHYFLFLDRETKSFLKNKDFLPNTILKHNKSFLSVVLGTLWAVDKHILDMPV